MSQNLYRGFCREMFWNNRLLVLSVLRGGSTTREARAIGNNSGFKYQTCAAKSRNGLCCRVQMVCGSALAFGHFHYPWMTFAFATSGQSKPLRQECLMRKRDSAHAKAEIPTPEASPKEITKN
ncbi:hypothetical protein ONS95_003248 [Cadophora gregata]|uniref:uncharacterized protein n=1 Tax=Cadophora gregata TaxID=51156 RepID=UPI0026DBCA7C|nr:uncharacterized protein ONS95_003248 [Cadophora gregata]KAK0108445.1 hypothetical protein ONS95_003248 [Cadophora gregata]